MPKNIIICSDGTGSKGGRGLYSNVWRVYDSFERENPSNVDAQIGIHDNGVGTDSFKLFRVLGGAFGWGITENLEQLYLFLIENYEPGDNIYLFGFSRGAFTARTFANILYYCGIADATGKDPEDLKSIAWQAIHAYKKRNYKDPNSGKPQIFREAHGLANPNGEQGRFPIKFVGVWDTVDAVGLPFDELTQAWIRVGLFQLNLHRPPGKNIDEWEDDLHPLIENAYHAMALDDERHTFHPTLWIEKNAAAQDTKVEQVWFAGVHTDVGGGYQKDRLCLIPLVWLMKKAIDCGLEFKDGLLDEFERDADEFAVMHDSRAGLAAYYRYRPRDIGKLCREVGIEPKIHHAALERIADRTNDYAPTGIPQTYETIEGQSPETDPAKRMSSHGIVDERIWLRERLYRVFILWTLAFLLCSKTGLPDWNLKQIPMVGPILNHILLGLSGVCILLTATRGGHVHKETNQTGQRRIRDRFGLAVVVATILIVFHGVVTSVLVWAAPGTLKGLLEPFQDSVCGTLVFGLVLYFLIDRNAQLSTDIRDASVVGWKRGLGRQANPPARGLWHRLARFGLDNLSWVDPLKRRCMPTLLAGLALLSILTAVILSGIYLVRTQAEAVVKVDELARDKNLALIPVETDIFDEVAEIEFDAREEAVDSEVILEPGTYRVEVWRLVDKSKDTIKRSKSSAGDTSSIPRAAARLEWRGKLMEEDAHWDWWDRTLPATPRGVIRPSSIQKLVSPLRRFASQPWYQLTGTIGKPPSLWQGNTPLIPIKDGGTFTIEEGGQLYLCINDICTPWNAYANNWGLAKVRIYRKKE